MVKRIVRALILLLVTGAVLVSGGLIALNNLLAPAIEKRIRQVIDERFDKRIEVAEVSVKLPEAIVRIKGFELAACSLGKYHVSINTGEALLHLSLLSTFLQQRFIFDEVSLEKGVLLLEKIAQPDGVVPPPSDSANTFTPLEMTHPSARQSPKGDLSLTGFTEIYINRLRAKNLDLIFRDYTATKSPVTIELCDIEGSVDRLLVSLKNVGNFKGTVHLKGYFNSAVRGTLKVDGRVERRKEQIDFDIKSNIHDADLTYFSPYYANTSFTILKEARVDIDSNAKCHNNELKTSHDAHIYNIRLNDVTPKADDTLFTLPATTVINFFKDYGGEVRFSFNIVGMLNDPKFEPSPIIQDVLSKALGDRIAARLKELPRDVAKISERAAKGDLDIGKESQIWLKELETRFEDFKKELKKKHDANKDAE